MSEQRIEFVTVSRDAWNAYQEVVVRAVEDLAEADSWGDIRSARARLADVIDRHPPRWSPPAEPDSEATR